MPYLEPCRLGMSSLWSQCRLTLTITICSVDKNIMINVEPSNVGAVGSRDCINTAFGTLQLLLFDLLSMTMAFISLLSGFSLTLSLFLGPLSSGFVHAVTLSSSGSSVSLDGIPYFISPYSSGKLSLDEVDVSACVSVGGLYPVTLLSDVTATRNFSVLMEKFMAEDDVFQAGFMQSMFEKITHQRSLLVCDVSDGLARAQQ
jgi:hypothetical protein